MKENIKQTFFQNQDDLSRAMILEKYQKAYKNSNCNNNNPIVNLTATSFELRDKFLNFLVKLSQELFTLFTPTNLPTLTSEAIDVLNQKLGMFSDILSYIYWIIFILFIFTVCAFVYSEQSEGSNKKPIAAFYCSFFAILISFIIQLFIAIFSLSNDHLLYIPIPNKLNIQVNLFIVAFFCFSLTASLSIFFIIEHKKSRNPKFAAGNILRFALCTVYGMFIFGSYSFFKIYSRSRYFPFMSSCITGSLLSFALGIFIKNY